MSIQQCTYGAHELMEVHELLNFKTICAAKAKAIDGLLTDHELKALVQRDLAQSLEAIRRLQEIIAPVTREEPEGAR